LSSTERGERGVPAGKNPSAQPSGRPPQTRPPKSPWTALRWALIIVLLISGAGVSGALIGLAASFRNLPDVRVLKNYNPSETTQILDVKGRLLANIYGEVNRRVVPLKNISPNLQRALMAIEDDQFYQHHGVRPDTIVRAALTNYGAGRSVQGGSTLTQQLIKNLFLTPEKNLGRKLVEAVLALRVEQVFKKDEILEMYLNQVYWGHNNYGAQTAAQAYFRKSAKDLTLAESAMLAGLIRAPEYYSPLKSPKPIYYKRAKKRQEVVLSRMLELGWITPQQAQAAKTEKLTFGTAISPQRKVTYFSTFVSEELRRKYGQDSVLKGGLRVQTTLDLDLQRLAENTVRNGVRKLRGRRVSQMALVSIDPRTGYVKAMVGGVDFATSQFNRVIQARRQPGSSFKPFVYYTAFARKVLSPDSILDDSPVTFGNYTPSNYDNTFMGEMTVRKALALSRNIPAVKAGKKAGLRNVVQTAKDVGIESPIQPNLSTSLGAVDISPMELARGYCAFANGGYRIHPTVIMQVTDTKGNLVEQNLPTREPTMNRRAVEQINSVLQSVVSPGGTGAAAQLPGRTVAGKTGTTQDFRDAWFVGYVPQLVTAIWIGNDNYSQMASGTAGGAYVAPIWKGYMQKALQGSPVLPFPKQGDGITLAELGNGSSDPATDTPAPTGASPVPVPAPAVTKNSKASAASVGAAIDEERPKKRKRRLKRQDGSASEQATASDGSQVDGEKPRKRRRSRLKRQDDSAITASDGSQVDGEKPKKRKRRRANRSESTESPSGTPIVTE
jgi:penicillin-binding protein 1A